MCKIYNPVGCLTAIKDHLKRHGINDFHSLQEVISFQKNFSILKQQIISDHEQLIESEKITLTADTLRLDNEINTRKTNSENSLRNEIEELTQKLAGMSISPDSGFVHKIAYHVKRCYIKRKLQYLEANLTRKVAYTVRSLVKQYKDKASRLEYITSNFRNAVNDSCRTEITVLENKQRIIEEVNNTIYGALGEQRVVKELENLSDENHLFNDFVLDFDHPIYNRQENDYIKSIQIDHLLITPAGIFLIETKNWSSKSLMNLDLRSPVQQVRRTNFALFKILSGNIANHRLRLKQHHWGQRKIPLRNLIVLTNSKPKEEFQYVKVLTVGELMGYIRYFKPTFTTMETQEIADYLLRLNDQKHLPHST